MILDWIFYEKQTFPKLWFLLNRSPVGEKQGIYIFCMHFVHEKYMDCSLFFASFLRLFFHVFSCLFEARFRYRFWTAFFMEKGTKITSKIDPRDDLFGKKGSQQALVTSPGSVLEPTFFRHRFFYVFWFIFCTLLDNVGPFGLHVGPFWLHFGSFLDAPGWILQEINRIWNRSSQVGFSQRIWSQNEKRNQTHAPQRDKPINRPGGMRARALNLIIY